jgi:hypothetical protein
MEAQGHESVQLGKIALRGVRIEDQVFESRPFVIEGELFADAAESDLEG